MEQKQSADSATNVSLIAQIKYFIEAQTKQSLASPQDMRQQINSQMEETESQIVASNQLINSQASIINTLTQTLSTLQAEVKQLTQDKIKATHSVDNNQLLLHTQQMDSKLRGHTEKIFIRNAENVSKAALEALLSSLPACSKFVIQLQGQGGPRLIFQDKNTRFYYMQRHVKVAFKAKLPSVKVIAALILLQREHKEYIYEWSKQSPDIAVLNWGDRLCSYNIQASFPFKARKVLSVGLPFDTIKLQLAAVAANIAQLRLSYSPSVAQQRATVNAADNTPSSLPVAQSYCDAAGKPASPSKLMTIKENIQQVKATIKVEWLEAKHAKVNKSKHTQQQKQSQQSQQQKQSASSSTTPSASHSGKSTEHCVRQSGDITLPGPPKLIVAHKPEVASRVL